MHAIVADSSKTQILLASQEASLCSGTWPHSTGRHSLVLLGRPFGWHCTTKDFSPLAVRQIALRAGVLNVLRVAHLIHDGVERRALDNLAGAQG